MHQYKKGDRVRNNRSGKVGKIVDLYGGLLYVKVDSAHFLDAPATWYYLWVNYVEKERENE